jgi:hypothetical protein
MITRRKSIYRQTWVAVVVLAIAGSAGLSAQEASRTVERIYQLDNEGDAQIEFRFQLGAQQWAMWKDQFGDHPDMMLRDIKYQLAAAVIDDFSLERDDVHRRATAKIKARSLARYRGDGQFQLQVPKEMKLVAGSGTEWVFTSSTLEGGGIVNLTDRAKLPTGAKNVHLTTGNDYDQLVYTVEVSPPRPKMLLYLGVGLLLVAAGLAGASFLRPSRSSMPPTAPASASV